MSSKAQCNGLKVLVTRPARQAASLVEAINRHGGTAHAFPLLDIKPIDPAPAILARVEEYDLVIFVSRNAVNCAWPAISSPISKPVTVAAVGKGTAIELERHGQPVQVIPEGRFDSDALLSRPELANVSGQKVLIVRGRDGREQLAETLRERGAKVDYAEVYQRLPTEQAFTYQPDQIDVIIITSSQALVHLRQIANSRANAWLLDTLLLVIHERIAIRAGELGFTLKPVIAEQASDAALLEALHLINH
jgi:uroporphyrinogen-III synthase